MKHILGFLAICIAACGCASVPAALADAPQLGTLELTLTKSTVTLGEPLILKYRVSNPEGQRVHVNIDNDVSGWLTITLNDAAGHPVRGTQTTNAITPVMRHITTDGVPIGPQGQHEGFLVLSQNSEPVQAGRYQITLTAHLTYAWGWQDMASENSKSEQIYSLPLTVTGRNPQRLRDVAEGLRQTVLHSGSADEYRLTNKALFAMRDPACLPVWRALATDANLDPWKAVDVMDQLKAVGSVSACDILAEMQPIAPERWDQVGPTPLSVLQMMWRPATPEVKQHINQLLGEAGFPAVNERTRPLGTMH